MSFENKCSYNTTCAKAFVPEMHRKAMSRHNS